MSTQTNIDAITRRKFLQLSALTALGAVITALPAEAGGLFSAPSSDEQKKVGDQAAKDILKKYREVHDARATHFRAIGQRLVDGLPQEDRKKWDFSFHVLDSKEVNAFALPGGPMFLFTGLYSQMKTDDEVAAVTGHEMTHVRKEHWAKAYAQSQQRQLGIAVILGLLHANRDAQSIGGLADTVFSLKYSRGEEQQADDGGMENLVAAGYNPQGMIDLFHTLQAVSGNGGGLGGDFLSDHPLTSDRIKHAQNKISQLSRDGRFPAMSPFNYKSLIG